MTIKQELEQAAEDNLLVRVYREGLEDGWAEGYVVGTGPAFFALELVAASVRYDGYNCMRYADVSGLDAPAPYGEFVERALKLRGLHRQGSPGVDLSTLPHLLREAGAAFPIVTIHLEALDSDVCYIGRVSDVTSVQVKLRPISPDGEWGDGVETYDLAEITRVDFGGDYEEALVLVADAG